jgi:hypothetical protein
MPSRRHFEAKMRVRRPQQCAPPPQQQLQQHLL